MDIVYGKDINHLMPLVLATILAILNSAAGCLAHVNAYYMKFRPYKACKTISMNFAVLVFLFVNIF